MSLVLKNLKTNEIAQFENLQDNWIEPTSEEIVVFLLSQEKRQKIQEIEDFHASPEVKKLTIKAGKLEAHIGVDQDSRYLLDEQIGLLRIRIELKEINPTWIYQNGVSVPLNLDQLKGLRLFIGQLTDFNFKAKKEAIKEINNLKTLEEIKNFDFKKNYKIKQIIPMAI